MRLLLNPNLTTLPFDGMDTTPCSYCEVPLEDGKVRRLLVPNSILEWMQSFDGSTSLEQNIASYVAAHPEVVGAHLKKLLSDYFLPKGVLFDVDEPIIRLFKTENSAAYVRLKVTLLPATFVRALSIPASLLFGWRRMLILSPVFLFCHLAFYFSVLPAYHVNLNDLHGMAMLQVIGILALLGIVHELGHAAALARFGYANASIGWGLYLAWTVFWTDLSDAWRLPRWERALVDVAGIYFHLLSLCILLVCIISFHLKILVYCFYLVDYQLLTCLNPLLRTDAFWFASDAFGIPDLREQSLALYQNAAHWCMRGRLISRRRILPLGWRINLFIAFYTGMTFLFAFYFAITAGYELFLVVAPALPRSLLHLWFELCRLPLGTGNFVSDFIATFFRSLALYGMVRFLLSAFTGAIRLFTRSTQTRTRAVPEPA